MEEQDFRFNPASMQGYILLLFLFTLPSPSLADIAAHVTGHNQKRSNDLVPELVARLLPYEFVSYTGIDCRVLSCRIMLLRNNTLKIVNSSRADEGNYVCRAENQLGSAEMTATLWVKGKSCPWGLYFLPN